MTYPNELHIAELKAQQLQEVIRSLGDNWTAKDLIAAGVSVNIDLKQQDYSVKALQYLSNCLHYATQHDMEIFSISICQQSGFDCLYKSKSGLVFNQKGEKLFDSSKMIIPLLADDCGKLDC